MGRAVVVWVAASVAAIVLGMVLAAVGSGVGAAFLIAGILSFGVFLLFGWWRATTQNDQWVWQTPHKPRRQYEAEKAARAVAETRANSASDSTPTLPGPA